MRRWGWRICGVGVLWIVIDYLWNLKNDDRGRNATRERKAAAFPSRRAATAVSRLVSSPSRLRRLTMVLMIDFVAF